MTTQQPTVVCSTDRGFVTDAGRNVTLEGVDGTPSIILPRYAAWVYVAGDKRVRPQVVIATDDLGEARARVKKVWTGDKYGCR